VGSTLVEAIASRHLVDGPRDRAVRAGDLVTLTPARTMSHDNTSAILSRFKSFGATRVLHPERCVVALDHDVQNRSEAHLEKYRAIEAFARGAGMVFHPAGSGIGHQIMVERLYVRPGELVVAADSHATTYGALGALGLPVARSDAAGIWATGIFWWEIPETVRVVFEGRLPAGACGKDVALVLCALYPDDVFGAAVEYAGPGVATLSMDDRLTIANMAAEWGAACGVFPADATCAAWIAERANALGRPATPATPPLRPDADASYAATISLDLARVGPHVAGPDSLSRATPVARLEGERIRIDKAYLVSCANGRASDLESAARVLRGRTVAPGVELYVAAASADVQREAERSGAWSALLASGARPLPTGCGPCIGLGAGLLASGETGISASNRNFKGRMGADDARCYLASPAVVAASAAEGFIRGVDAEAPAPDARRIERHGGAMRRVHERSRVAGFPESLEGRAVVFLRDGIDTDALCPSRLVYRDDATPEELAEGVLHTLAPGLAARLRRGDVLVAGLRFGIGSSREQAARSLRAAGIAAVVAGSLAPVFRRNAYNNGLLAIEAPALVEALAAPPDGNNTVPWFSPAPIRIDLVSGTIVLGEVRVTFPPLPEVAQRLLAAGGLDGFLRERIGA
jgi:homoaconitate hydratase